MNAKNKRVLKRACVDLLKVTAKTVGYAKQTASMLREHGLDSMDGKAARATALQLEHYIDLPLRVIDQTESRVLKGESVDSSEKIVSIFEPNTDIIVKGNREPHYGHKICLTGGSSNLIVDCVMVEGNPANTSLTNMRPDRQNDIYDRYPLKAALDGGFASGENLTQARSKGIKDVCFAKKKGLEVEDMCRSEWVYKQLRRFRAGVESGISWLKRCFGLTGCSWKAFRAFKSYVRGSIVTANLLTLARKEMT